jgi:hypothetical protein
LRDLLGSDDVKDPIRIMRLGGCVNYPTEKKRERGYVAELVTVKIAKQSREYSIEELIGAAPSGQGSRGRGYGESEEKPAPTVESFFKDVNALALARLSHWVKPLFGNLVKFYSRKGCWRTTPKANKVLPGRANLEETISISQRGVYDFGLEKPSDPIGLVKDYGPQKSSIVPTTAKEAAFWLCERMNIAPEALGWGTRERRSADDAGYEEGYGFSNAGASEAPQPGADKAPTADPVDLWAKFDAPTLPRGILPDLIERFAFDRGQAMGADMAGIAVSALAVCAAAIPDKIKLQVKRHDEWRESARIWVAIVGSPSSKKSPIMNAAVRPLRKIDAEMAREYAERRSSYDKLDKKQKAKTDPPKQTRLLLQDTTIEAAQEVIKDSPNGVLCFQDEMSGWFGSMDKYSNARGAAKDRAFWLEAFNGNPYSVHRVGRGSVYIENLSASLIGGIQPEPFRKVADDSADDGLLQRLLPVILKPAVEGRDEQASEVVSEYAALIRRLHELDSPIRGGVAMDFNAAQPQGGFVLRFDDRAQAYRQELERKHLKLQDCESINRKLASHIGKYDGIFARLCVIWHCIEAAHGALPAVISEATARRAGAFLHAFLLPHAIAFYAGVLGLSNDDDSLKAVAGYILAHKLERVTNRDVQRGDGTMRKLDKQGIEAVLYQLSALGWLDRVDGPRASSQPQWVVNPVVHVRYEQRAAAEKERRERERKLLAEMFGGSS